MNQQELEALLKQIAPNNDPGRLEFSESTDTVEVDERTSEYAPPTKVKRPVKVLTWIDRGTGQTLRVQLDPQTGTYTKQFQGVDPKMQGEPATTPAQVAKDEQGTEVGTRQETDAQGKTVKVTTYRRSDGTTYERTDVVQAAPKEPDKPTIAPGAAGRPAVQYVPDPDHPGQVKAVPIPGAPDAPGEIITAPSDQMWTVSRQPDGTYKQVKNPNYVKPSRIMPDPGDPTKLINITHDDNGNVVALPVTGTTTIKPADLPVLQAKYGEIAQSLGALAQELNGRVARGEMTPQQRTEAFTAAHAQASTQVSEINSILENSKAIWSGQVTQRGQTLSETQSRRAFASDAAGRAMQTGLSVAQHSGRGSGAAIAAGVEALMGMQQKYAQGMGGFRESPEIGLPPALEQARGVSLPGFGPGAATPPSPTGPAGPGASPPAVSGAPPAVTAPTPPPPGITNTTDAGGVPREYSPASSTVGSGLPPAVSGLPTAVSGLPTAVSGMGSALVGAVHYAGAPVAAGGAGVWNPMPTATAMLGDGADPDWAEAVRRAAQLHGGFGG